MIEEALYIAFCVVGIIQYLKGICKELSTKTWAILQPAIALVLALSWAELPYWVSVGVLAFAMSQIGYETIIQTIKKKIREDK